MSSLSVTTVVGVLAFCAGIVFGGVAQRTAFCLAGALSDAMMLSDTRRLRMWLLAIAVAVLGTQLLEMGGLVALGTTVYRSPSLGWLGGIVGGLLFGFGMALTGGCLQRSLVRVGAGNLKSLIVVLVAGLFAYMTLRGLLAVPRLALVEAANLDLGRLGLTSQGVPELLSAASGLYLPLMRLLVVALTVISLVAWCLQDEAFRSAPRHIAGGAVIGLLIPVGWVITGVIGSDEAKPQAPASFGFAAPLGESIVYLLTFPGATITFGIAAAGGVLAGAFISSLSMRQFRLETFADPGETLRHLSGGALMGIGGVLALGCTIGQGMTGLSTLSLGSLIALAAMMTGGVLGLNYLEEGSVTRALRAMRSTED